MTEVLVVGAGLSGFRWLSSSRVTVFAAASSIPSRSLNRVAGRRGQAAHARVWDDIGIPRDMIDAGIRLEGMRSVVHGHPAQRTII
jgi:hypothetical protein